MTRNKYNAVKTVVDGITFDSKKEAKRYAELKLLEKAGEISGLLLQPPFKIEINGVKICTYIADFQYVSHFKHEDDKFVVEDVKGVKTAIYRLKKKLVKAVYDIDIVEI